MGSGRSKRKPIMNNRTKSLKNLAYSALGEGVAVACGLLLPRLWAVSYGSEVNGLLSSLTQFLVYLYLFEAGVGAATMQALYKPVALQDWNQINRVLSATNIYYRKTGFYYLGGILLLSIVYPFVVDSYLAYWVIVGAVFFSGIGNAVNFWFKGKYTYLLQTDGKLYVLTNLTTIVTVLTSLSKVILILLDTNIVLILAVSFTIQCLETAFVLWYIKKSYPNIDLHAEPDYQAISQKNSVMVHQISSLVFYNTDVLILTILCDLRVVSVYTMFKLVTSHLQKVIDLPFKSLSFSLGQTFHVDRNRFLKQIDLVESFNSALVYALFSVALFLFLPFMRLYTAGITDINYIDPYLAILFVLCSLLDQSRRPMMSVIEYAGHFKKTTPYTIAEASINLVVSLIGAFYLGIYGVLIGTVISLAYRTNQMFLYSNKKILERSAATTYKIYLVDIVMFVIIQLVLRYLFGGYEITNYVKFAGAGVVSSLIAVLIMFSGHFLLLPHCRKWAISMLRRMRK